MIPQPDRTNPANCEYCGAVSDWLRDGACRFCGGVETGIHRHWREAMRYVRTSSGTSPERIGYTLDVWLSPSVLWSHDMHPYGPESPAGAFDGSQTEEQAARPSQTAKWAKKGHFTQ